MEVLSREELIVLVEKIMNCVGTEEEIDNMLELVENNVAYAEISDLIFWGDDDKTPAEIVDFALSYKPLEL